MGIQDLKQWEFLKSAAERGKIPHALLFAGPNREEKKTLAYLFLQLLNCQEKDFGSKPCQVCRQCREIKKNASPDLCFVSPQDEDIKISQVRGLQDFLSFKPYSNPFKAAIIDQAHLLNQEAQSAFLKLLEEPKGSTIFVLLTEYPALLLPTILSRVEKLRFYFPQKDVLPEDELKKISRIAQSDLNYRFRYAKELAQDPQGLKKTLETWLNYFREEFLSNPNQPKIIRILKSLQATHHLVSTTNVNARLALEILMLEL